MTREESQTRLAELRTAERLLVYGGGYLAASQLPLMAGVGLKVAGVIDKYKTGALKYKGGELPIYSIAEAATAFGPDTTVLLAVNAKWHDEVRRDLAAAGFAAANVIDWQDLTEWLTVPSDKCWCNYLQHFIVMFRATVQHCCNSHIGRVFRVCGISSAMDLRRTMDFILERHQWCHEEARSGRVPLVCKGCPELTARPVPDATALNHLALCVDLGCNIDCVYCSNEKNAALLRNQNPYSFEQYADAFQYLVETAISRGMVAGNLTLGFLSGDPSIFPPTASFLDFMRRHSQISVSVRSNCTVYQPRLAEMLALNPRSSLMCDLDAGTRESYVAVKGVDAFDRVVENLKRYREVCANITLKYLVIPGFNTSEADYQGQMEILRGLGLRTIMLTHDAFRPMTRYDARQLVVEMGRFKALLTAHGFAVSLSDCDAKYLGQIDKFCKQFRRIRDPEGCERQAEQAESLRSAPCVLAYGAGRHADTALPPLLLAGLNVAGIIDKNKIGVLTVGERELPIYTIDAAVTKFGADTPVLLTVLDKDGLHDEVRRDLAAAGFDGGRVFNADELGEWL